MHKTTTMTIDKRGGKKKGKGRKLFEMMIFSITTTDVSLWLMLQWSTILDPMDLLYTHYACWLAIIKFIEDTEGDGQMRILFNSFPKLLQSNT